MAQEPTNKKMKQVKGFYMPNHWKRKIALKICYLGWNYNGNTTNGTVPLSDENTVEARLLEALVHIKLIDDVTPDNCGFARCGRTDKGVSAFANIVSLTVRSNLHGSGAVACSDAGLVPAPEPIENRDVDVEIDYVHVINRALPDDIRVLAWTPVDDDFDARFSAKARTYKYYFLKDGLDLDAMREALRNFEGLHDFRNLCKIDVKATNTFKRRILETEIFASDEANHVYVARIKGSAFLWHMIRFIMSVLFHVGRGLEKPSIVRDLLDIEQMPARPEFLMASDLPLVLYQCDFDDGAVEWRAGPGREGYPNHFSLYRQLHEAYEKLVLQASIVKDMMEECMEPEDVEHRQRQQYLVGGVKKHVPFLKRKTLKSVDQKRAQLAAKEAVEADAAESEKN